MRENIDIYCEIAGTSVSNISKIYDSYVKNINEEFLSMLKHKNTDKEKKTSIIFSLIKNIPFDYTMNLIKLKEVIKKNTLIDLEKTKKIKNNLYYLRGVEEFVEDFLKFKTGGDCFTTSLFVHLFYLNYGIQSNIHLADEHHCVVTININNKKYYIDTSLNLEKLVKLPEKETVVKSKIFELKIKKENGFFYVFYIPHFQNIIKNTLSQIFKKEAYLWKFNERGNNLKEIIPYMLYTLHPFTPTSKKENKYNRNQQVRVSALINNQREIERRRIFYNEKREKYILSVIKNRKRRDIELNVRHNKNREIENKEEFIEIIHNLFGIDRNILEKSLYACDYINRKYLERQNEI